MSLETQGSGGKKRRMPDFMVRALEEGNFKLFNAAAESGRAAAAEKRRLAAEKAKREADFEASVKDELRDRQDDAEAERRKQAGEDVVPLETYD